MFSFSHFRGRYRIASTRLPGHNYGREGIYFITICTKNRRHYFGEIVNGEMRYSVIGKIAARCWDMIPKHFPNAILDEWVIMPDHMHGIIVINAHHDVETRNCASLPERFTGNRFGPQSRNIPSIIRAYKSTVKKYANIHNIPFTWQSGYYDRIIWDQRGLDTVRRYIRNNPRMWHN